MKIACIIPARLASTRFPRKILAPLHGKPLLQHVWEAAQKVSLFDSVTIAVDAEETLTLARSFGAHALLTSPHCSSGTLRLAELEKRAEVKADIYVNWQGDEPFIHEKLIHTLTHTCGTDQADIWTLKKSVFDPIEASSPHVVKVVCTAQGYALYFSRCPIPFHRDHPFPHYFKHLGLYAYTQKALRKIGSLPPSPLEEAEKLEQLSFLYYGLKIRVHETEEETLGIDLPEHLKQAHNR